MAEKNGNSITWSKLGLGLAGIVIGLVVYIWTFTIPPAAGEAISKNGRADSVSVARITLLENKIFADSIKQERTIDLLLRIVDKLDGKIPTEGPHR